MDPVLSPDLVGVHGSRGAGKGDPACCANFVLQTRHWMRKITSNGAIVGCNLANVAYRSRVKAHFSLLSRSLSSCRLSGLRAITNPSGDSVDGGVDAF